MKHPSLIFVFLGLFVLLIYMNSLHGKKLRKEFNSLSTEDQFFGQITDIYHEKGTNFISAGSRKIRIKYSKNYLYPDETLSDNIFVGDSIAKKANSDTLFIFRDNKSYYFVIGEYINEQYK